MADQDEIRLRQMPAQQGAIRAHPPAEQLVGRGARQEGVDE
jgi:hypothetical protein